MEKLNQIARRGGRITFPFLLVRSMFRLIARRTRVILFRHVHGIDVARRVFLGPGISFINPKNVTLSEGSSLAAGVNLWTESKQGCLFVGPGAQVNRRAYLDFSGGLTLERDVLVSAEAIIYTHDHGRDPRSAPTFSSLVIREGAWVGVRAIVLPSVNYIGVRAVIGAGAVVTHDVPDGATFVGARGRIVEREHGRRVG